MLQHLGGVLAVVVLLASGGGAFLWYRRRVRLRLRQDSWRELCLRLELAPQPGEARVARGELRQTPFVLHDTGSEWLVEVPLAQPLLPPGLLLLSPDASRLPPRTRLRSLEWASASTPPELRAWCVEGAELSGKVEASQAFLDEATRAMRAHAPLRVESRRLIQALRVGALLSVKEAREAVLALEATARGWLGVAEHSGLPRVQAPSAPEVHPPPRSVPPPRDFSPRRAASRLLGVLLALWAWAMAGRGASSRFGGGVLRTLWTCAVAGIGALSLFSLYRLATDSFGDLWAPTHHESAIVFFVGAVFFLLAAVLILLFQGKRERAPTFRPRRRLGGPLAQELPTRGLPLSLLLLALMVSAVLGSSIWLVRNRLSDAAAFKAAQLDETGEALKEYANREGHHAAEARQLGMQRASQYCERKDTAECWKGVLSTWGLWLRTEGPIRERMHRAALKATPRTVAGLKSFLEHYPGSVVDAEVREQLLPVAEFRELPANSIRELRRFRGRYPGSPVDAQAQARLHELFAAAQARFLSHASPENPQAVEFMSKLLTHLESSGSSQVRVGFRRNASSSLQGADSLVGQAQRLEGPAVKQLGNAFPPFLSDTMTLEHSELPPRQREDTGVTRPRIDIDYTMGASGWTYTLGRNGRQLAAIQFDFRVALRMPGAQPVHFSLQTRPPRDFPFDGLGPDSTDSAVYNAMAQRAFHELRGRFGAVFFRADCNYVQAFKQRTR